MLRNTRVQIRYPDVDLKPVLPFLGGWPRPSMNCYVVEEQSLQVEPFCVLARSQFSPFVLSKGT